jgi:hypothetical protein
VTENEFFSTAKSKIRVQTGVKSSKQNQQVFIIHPVYPDQILDYMVIRKSK